MRPAIALAPLYQFFTGIDESGAKDLDIGIEFLMDNGSGSTGGYIGDTLVNQVCRSRLVREKIKRVLGAQPFGDAA